MSVMAILIACGKEEEIASGVETAFLSMGSRPVLALSLLAFQSFRAVDEVVVVVSKPKIDATVQVIKRFGCSKVKGVVVGGVNRRSSLRNVLGKVDLPATVLIHEVSRPFVSGAVVNDCVKAAKRYGCAIASHRLEDSIKRAPRGLKVVETMERGSAWAAQSPQVFRQEVLEKIIGANSSGEKWVDDESGLVDRSSDVHLIEAGSKNMKIRTVDDLAIAVAIHGVSSDDGRSL